jgi:HD-like signal output (HDOD) protein/CheY-like chemotaxis protein
LIATRQVDRKRILFVDDDQMVLQGLQMALRRQRHRWDMVFVGSGAAALDELKRSPCDVVVSDMRMPGMDGPALLQRVKEDHPGAARLVLSGQAQRESLVRVMAVAHQFLDKPCRPERLVTALERALELQVLLADEGIRGAVAGLDRLPSLPRSYLELTAAAADPHSGVADLSRIVESDTAMSAKVLQLVNSAYFGLQQPMANVAEAVCFLGAELLKGLTLTAQLFMTMEGMRPIPGFSPAELQQHSLQAARLARRFAGTAPWADECFTAALVHEIGQMVLAMSLRERFERVLSTAHRERRPLHLVEKEALGVTHAEVGGYLLGIWGLPHAIVDAVVQHHGPGDYAGPSSELVGTVHVACAIGCRSEGDPVDEDFLARTGLLGRLGGWRAAAAELLAS